VIGRSFLERRTIEHHKAREIVSFSLKKIGDVRVELFAALLKEPKYLSLVRQFMVTSLVQLQKHLFAGSDRVVDVDHLIGRVENAEDFTQRLLNEGSGFRTLRLSVFFNGRRVEDAVRGYL
jgi:hypothetical protein